MNPSRSIPLSSFPLSSFPRIPLPLLLFITFLISACRTAAQPIDILPYAWEFPNVTNIQNAGDLVDELRAEIQEILDAGHLAPLNCRYGDLMPSTVEAHFVYQEPGRIITTLAWAFPHLTPNQQNATRNYIASELADPRFAPWGEHPMPRDVGARREWHPMDRVWGAEIPFGKNRPAIQSLYGLWLYAFRSGDWSLIQSHWNEIRSCYTRRSEEGALYGTLCAHVAVARLAHQFNDPNIRNAALTNLQSHLNAATNFNHIEDLCRTRFYREHYTRRNATDRALYHGAMFLGLAPEIGRFLSDHLRDAVLTRHRQGTRRFPLWWLVQAPYFCRWTGDESVGLSPEAIGMIAPIERWVAHTGTAALRRYVSSVPNGRGDCFWIEMLVQTIEAHGSLRWIDVRSIPTL